MKVAVLFSGGKDSCLALWYAIHQGWEVVTLISMHPENRDSWMFHYPAIAFTKLQAELMDLPLIAIETSGEKDEELEDLSDCLRNMKELLGVETVVSGVVASEFQKTRVDSICDKIGLRSFTPLWLKDPRLLVRLQIEFGFEMVVTAVMAQGFSESWLGRRLDLDCLRDIIYLNQKYGVHISGEGGEYETFVTYSPLFKSKIKILEVNREWDAESFHGILEIKKAEVDQPHNRSHPTNFMAASCAVL